MDKTKTLVIPRGNGKRLSILSEALRLANIGMKVVVIDLDDGNKVIEPIKGRRMTDSESMGMLFDDAPDVPYDALTQRKESIAKYETRIFRNRSIPRKE